MEPEEKNKKQIGIKLADGHFYPVFDEGFHGKRKLVLTTVRDDQQSVQIDLFKGSGEVLFEDTYIGSLVIENIGQAPKGVPEIELDIGIDENGNLAAMAYDSKSGEKQSLSVSLESVEEKDMYTIPEFEINQEEEPSPSDEEIELEAQTIIEETPQAPRRGAKEAGAEKRRGNPLLLILFILLGLIVIAVAGWGIYAGLKGIPFIPGSLLSAAPAKETDESASQAKEKEEQAGEEVAADEQAAVQEEDKAAETTQGEEYVIVWGDTLWDISRHYYRDPFQYKMLAKVNKIQNPDLIFAKQKIFIPAK